MNPIFIVLIVVGGVLYYLIALRLTFNKMIDSGGKRYGWGHVCEGFILTFFMLFFMPVFLVYLGLLWIDYNTSFLSPDRIVRFIQGTSRAEKKRARLMK